MLRLPVIVGFGGVNAAGRSSAHHAYHRLVFDALDQKTQNRTLQSLAQLMGQQTIDQEYLLNNTLIRRIQNEHFDPDNIIWNKRFPVEPNSHAIEFTTKANALPDVIPSHWQVRDLGNKKVHVTIDAEQDLLLPTSIASTVKAAGQLPTGFDPAASYASRNHPRGIAMTVYGASDALQSMGIDWGQVQKRVSPDQISVYAGSGMSQLDAYGNGGMMMSRLYGKKVSSKQCPFGFAEMPADFINAYLLGSIGNTGTSMGACASFLYNLRNALTDIQSGRARVAIVGNAEAPILPEVIEGYAAMGALVTDDDLREMDNLAAGSAVNHRRTCRPFSTNKGFTIAESAQFIVLFDDALAVELGATIYGAVSDVFVNADGFKKSIASPGVGNYVTVAKASAAAAAIVGEKAFRERSFIQAHGTSTPQNRVTESHILNEVAKHFGIDNWLVGAVKSYLGHSIGCAAGDQITSSLGIWHSGIFPGITTIDHIAEDVHHDHLNLSMKHLNLGAQALDVGIINAKGFGGNNASATLLAPHIVEKMLNKHYSGAQLSTYKKLNEQCQEKSAAYDEAVCTNKAQTLYLFDNGVQGAEDVSFADNQLKINGFEQVISLEINSPYANLLD